MPSITLEITQQIWDALYKMAAEAQSKDNIYHNVEEMAQKILNDHLDLG